jgi:hypothetical protein
MKTSIRTGLPLPTCQADFEWIKEIHKASYTNCIECGGPFGAHNVASTNGWKETQISGLCENCWEELFAEDGEGKKEEPPV